MKRHYSDPEPVARRRFVAGMGALLASPVLPLAGCAQTPAAPPPRPDPLSASASRFVTMPDMPSRHVAPRNVTVWLPTGYDSSTERYDVLYMHDGQNLFDADRSISGQVWAVDTHLHALASAGRARPAIVVGIDNSRQRWREYLPAGPLRAMPERLLKDIGGREAPVPLSDDYLRFLVEELKPHIDREYRTRPQPEHTIIMGASMGALVSLYALARHPQVFGAAGCLSTHWPLTAQRKLLRNRSPLVDEFFGVALQWFEQQLPAAGRHRLYFDHGDKNLDGLYPPLQRQVDAMVQRKGYRQGVDWMTRHFPGADHEESVWRARLAVPLQFLLKA